AVDPAGDLAAIRALPGPRRSLGAEGDAPSGPLERCDELLDAKAARRPSALVRIGDEPPRPGRAHPAAPLERTRSATPLSRSTRGRQPSTAAAFRTSATTSGISAGRRAPRNRTGTSRPLARTAIPTRS